MAGGFRFLDHMSDVYVEAYGDTLEEAYAQAGLALFRTLIPEADGVEREMEVKVQGEDLQQLLYNWLEELLIRFELEGIVGTEIEVKKIEKTDTGYLLEAVVKGVNYDPGKHRTGTAVKAPTYALMEIDTEAKRLRYVLDI